MNELERFEVAGVGVFATQWKSGTFDMEGTRIEYVVLFQAA